MVDGVLGQTGEVAQKPVVQVCREEQGPVLTLNQQMEEVNVWTTLMIFFCTYGAVQKIRKVRIKL